MILVQVGAHAVHNGRPNANDCAEKRRQSYLHQKDERTQPPKIHRVENANTALAAREEMKALTAQIYGGQLLGRLSIVDGTT